VTTRRIECQIEFLLNGNTHFDPVKVDCQWKFLTVLENADRNFRRYLIAEILNRQGKANRHTD